MLYSIITLFLVSACISNNRSNTTDSSTAPQDPNLAALEQRASELDGMFNVAARKYVDVYFTLSDIYAEKKDYEKAYRTVIKGLQLDSSNYSYQYKAAFFE